MTNWNLTVFYDGACPFCSREIRFLMRRNQAGRLHFIDTADPQFQAAEYGIPSHHNRIIHAMLPDRSLITGMEVFRRAYNEVGLGWLLAPTGWPLLKPVFDKLYLLFARYRKTIGKFLGGNNLSCST